MALPIASHRDIPFIYRLYFLYLEPLFVLQGIYMCIFTPASYLAAVAPLALHVGHVAPTSVDVTPLTKLLLVNTASLYIVFLVLEVYVLRTSYAIGFWKMILAAILMCDVGHLAAIYVAGPEVLEARSLWRMEDYINVGILSAGVLLRASFLLGIGVRSRMS